MNQPTSQPTDRGADRREGPPSSPSPRPSFGRDLTTGSIPRHLVAFALPMLAGSALQTSYAFVNAIWVGQFLGKDALAAIGVSFPVIFVLIAWCSGLTLASNILIAQYRGARDMASVRRVVHSSTVLILAMSIVLLAAGWWAAPAILEAMGTPPMVLGIASSYLRIFLLSFPAGFLLFLVRAMLQGIGDTTTILYFQGGSVLLTAVLDPVLMLGWPRGLGIPALGLNGTAWATLIAQGLAVAALIVVLRRRRNPVAPALSWRNFDVATAWTTIRIGVPSAVQQSLVSVSMVFVTSIVNGFGPGATAAYGVVTRVDQLVLLPAMTLGLAIATLAGQNIGAQRHDRVRGILMWGCLLNGAITAVASIAVVSLPTVVLRIFTSDLVVIDTGSHYLRIVGSCYVFFAVMFVSNGIINGSGHTLATTLITLLSLWVVRVPGAWCFSHWLGTIQAVWYAIGLSFAVSMAASLAYYLTGRWRRAVVRRLPVTEPVEGEA